MSALAFDDPVLSNLDLVADTTPIREAILPTHPALQAPALLGASAHGLVWLDANGNGIREAGEAGLPGVTVYSDLNGNAALDPTEPRSVSMQDDPFTQLDEAGLAWLELDAGSHVIRTVTPDQMQQTFPTFPAEGHAVHLADGDVVEGLDFGFFPLDPGSIHGTVWIDVNANGQRDPNEPGLPGVTIYSDLDRDGELDPTEPRTISMRDDPATAFDEAGHYWLEEVEPGIHLIREIPPPDAATTYPREGHFVALDYAQVVEGIDFGILLSRAGSIHGIVWRDANRNGIRDESELGLPGVIVYVDTNDNCVFDREDIATRTMADDPFTFQDESGRYWLEGIDPGEATVRLSLPTDLFPLSPIGGALLVDVPEAAATTGWDFGLGENGAFASFDPTRLDVESPDGTPVVTNAGITIHPLCIRPFEITTRPSDPTALVENLDGIHLNGCGGDTSSFSLRFTPREERQCYQLLFVDTAFGGSSVLGSIPVVVPEPGFGVALLAGSIALATRIRRQPRAHRSRPE